MNTPLSDRINQRNSAHFQQWALAQLAYHVNTLRGEKIQSHPAYLLIGAFVRLIESGMLDSEQARIEFSRHING